jgi:hypothetical protein
VPKQIPFTFSKEGEAATFKFAAVAGKIHSGRETLRGGRHRSTGQQISQSSNVFRTGMWKLPLYRKADSDVVAFDFRLPAS